MSDKKYNMQFTLDEFKLLIGNIKNSSHEEQQINGCYECGFKFNDVNHKLLHERQGECYYCEKFILDDMILKRLEKKVNNIKKKH